MATRGLCAIAQAESLRYKLIGGLAVRRACYGVLRFIMESGAKGCEECEVRTTLYSRYGAEDFDVMTFFLQADLPWGIWIDRTEYTSFY